MFLENEKGTQKQFLKIKMVLQISLYFIKMSENQRNQIKTDPN